MSMSRDVMQYTLIEGNRSFVIVAEREGCDRYMVRMREIGTDFKERIGYLTGSGNNWVAEFLRGSKTPFLSTHSARAACMALASSAIKAKRA